MSTEWSKKKKESERGKAETFIEHAIRQAKQRVLISRQSDLELVRDHPDLMPSD